MEGWGYEKLLDATAINLSFPILSTKLPIIRAINKTKQFDVFWPHPSYRMLSVQLNCLKRYLALMSVHQNNFGREKIIPAIFLTKGKSGVELNFLDIENNSLRRWQWELILRERIKREKRANNDKTFIKCRENRMCLLPPPFAGASKAVE